ncbi:MAG: AsnC family transcriptional regulator [Chloroflexi bacterium]|nr:AsnC family transcriptional regulator [Chloroflexota bacterium]
MDDRDRQLLNAMQAVVPLVPRPYRALGEQVGLTEADVLARLERLRRGRILRQICAIFDARSLGYETSLVAAQYPAERLEQAAEIVNSHPGVTHNYQRDHEFNLWYTIAVAPGGDLGRTVGRLHELSGATSTRLLPALRLFKIGVNLDLTGDRAADTQSATAYSDADRAKAAPGELSAEDVALVRELQGDLPSVEQPFQPMAERLGWSQEALFARAVDMRRRGLYRRYAALLRHREAGFKANAMGVWAVPLEQAAEVGARMAGFAAVSHCYERPTYPDWPYSVFTMVHGQSRDECEAVLSAISRTVGVSDYRSLYSTREYKKTRLTFFTDAYAEWDRLHLSAPAGTMNVS